MSSHSNLSNAHDFYYIGVDKGEAHSYSGCTLSYNGAVAYSYSTVIARVVPRRGFKESDMNTYNTMSAVALVSSELMSATTSKHISDVRGASPFTVIEVPMNRGGRSLEPYDIRDNMLKKLAYLAENLNLAKFRGQFAELMHARTLLLDMACEKWAKPMRDKRFDKYLKLDIDKYANELKERNRKSASKKAAESRAVLKKYVGDRRGADYLEFVRALVDRYYCGTKYRFTDTARALLRKKFVNTNYAYVWLSDDGAHIKTSRGVTVPVDDAKLAMTAWAHGHDMRKFIVSRYSIVKYEGSIIQIGCHQIPRENMLALYEAVMGKPFALMQKMQGEGEKRA